MNKGKVLSIFIALALVAAIAFGGGYDFIMRSFADGAVKTTVKAGGFLEEPLLVLLVEFQDQELIGTEAAWKNKFFNGTVPNYFKENSKGYFKFVPYSTGEMEKETYTTSKGTIYAGTDNDGVLTVKLDYPFPGYEGLNRNNFHNTIVKDAMELVQGMFDISESASNKAGVVGHAATGTTISRDLHVAFVVAGVDNKNAKEGEKKIDSYTMLNFNDSSPVKINNEDGTHAYDFGRNYMVIPEQVSTDTLQSEVMLIKRLAQSLGLLEFNDTVGKAVVGNYSLMTKGYEYGYEDGKIAPLDPLSRLVLNEMDKGRTSGSNTFAGWAELLDFKVSDVANKEAVKIRYYSSNAVGGITRIYNGDNSILIENKGDGQGLEVWELNKPISALASEAVRANRRTKDTYEQIHEGNSVDYSLFIPGYENYGNSSFAIDSSVVKYFWAGDADIGDNQSSYSKYLTNTISQNTFPSIRGNSLSNYTFTFLDTPSNQEVRVYVSNVGANASKREILYLEQAKDLTIKVASAEITNHLITKLNGEYSIPQTVKITRSSNFNTMVGMENVADVKIPVVLLDKTKTEPAGDIAGSEKLQTGAYEKVEVGVKWPNDEIAKLPVGTHTIFAELDTDKLSNVSKTPYRVALDIVVEEDLEMTVDTLTFDPPTLTLSESEEIEVTVQYKAKNGGSVVADWGLHWQTSNSRSDLDRAAADVRPSYDAQGNIIPGRAIISGIRAKEGETVTITATSTDPNTQGQVSAVLEVTVMPYVAATSHQWAPANDNFVLNGGFGQLDIIIDPAGATQNGTKPMYKWSSSDPKTIEIDENTGRMRGLKVTAKSGKEYPVIIMATPVNPKDSANLKPLQAQIHVYDASGIPVSEFKVSPKTVKTTVREKPLLTAVVTPQNATSAKNITWVSGDPNTVRVNSSTGELTPLKVSQTTTDAEGNTVYVPVAITATLNENGKLWTDTAQVTVTEHIYVETIDIEPVAPFINTEIEIDGNVKLKYTITPADASITTVKWVSTNPSIAKVEDAGDGYGIVTGLRAGRTMIKAQSTDNNVPSNSVEITVIARPIPVTSVGVTPLTTKLGVNQQMKLGTTVQPANATDKTLKWESSDPEIVKVDLDGTITGIKEGEAKITVSPEAAQDARVSATMTVSVVLMATDLDVNQSSIDLKINETAKLQTVYKPSSAESPDVKWKSDNPGIAMVDSKGQVRGMGEGNTKVTATITGTNITAETLVYVAGVSEGGSGGGSSTDDEDKLGIRPEDTEYIIEEIRNSDKYITIDMDGEDIWAVSRKVFIELSKHPDKFLTFKSKYYVWQFKGSDITESMNLNLRVYFNTDFPFEMNKLLGNIRKQYLSFEHSGPLPGTATFRVALREKLNKERLYYYYYNEQRNILELRYNNLYVGHDGWITYKMATCSDYVLTDFAVKGAQGVANPSTGRGSAAFGWADMAVLGGALAAGGVYIKCRRK